MNHPLNNIEAEQTLIGLMLSDNSTIDMAADRLTREAFVDPVHADTFELMVRDYALGKTVTPVTLKTYFEGSDALDEYGGARYFGELAAGAGFFPAKPVIDELAGLAVRRRMRAGLETAANACGDLDCTLGEIVNHADAAISDKSGEIIHQPTAAEAIRELIDSFEDDHSGIECQRIPAFDEALGAIRPKELIILAGRPGMGKTAAALSYAIGAAEAGHGVLYASLEMSSTELAGRMASDICFEKNNAVPYAGIVKRNLTHEQKRHVAAAYSHATSLPFSVIDTGSLTIGRLNMLVRRHARKMKAAGFNLDLVIVDYLQLLHPDNKGRSVYEAVSEVSRGLKAMAKDNGIAIMALAQLSRAVETRPDKRPMLSDIRDSGQIEQDADGVVFLFRPEYYLKAEEPEQVDDKRAKWESDMRDAQGVLEIIVAKRRNGETGSKLASFDGKHQAVR